MHCSACRGKRDDVGDNGPFTAATWMLAEGLHPGNVRLRLLRISQNYRCFDNAFGILHAEGVGMIMTLDDRAEERHP